MSNSCSRQRNHRRWLLSSLASVAYIFFKWAKNILHHKRVSLRWHCFGKACVNAGHFYWHAIHLINRCSLDFTTHLTSHKHIHRYNFFTYYLHAPYYMLGLTLKEERIGEEKKQEQAINSMPIINFVRVVEEFTLLWEPMLMSLALFFFFYCCPVYFPDNISFRENLHTFSK